MLRDGEDRVFGELWRKAGPQARPNNFLIGALPRYGGHVSAGRRAPHTLVAPRLQPSDDVNGLTVDWPVRAPYLRALAMLPRCDCISEVQWARKLDMLTAPGPQGLGSLRSNSQLDLFQSRKNTPSTILRLQQQQQPDQQQEAYVSSFDKKVRARSRSPARCPQRIARWRGLRSIGLLPGNENKAQEL